MNLSRFNYREKKLAVATGVLIASVLFFTGVIDPQLKHYDVLRKNLSNLQIRYTKMKADLLMQDRVNQAYENIKAHLPNRGTEQQQISLFTREINDLYSNQNLKIKSVKILPSLKDSHYLLLTMKVELIGNVKDFLKLITLVETQDKPIRIESFEIKSQEVVDMVQISLVITKIAIETKG